MPEGAHLLVSAEQVEVAVQRSEAQQTLHHDHEISWCRLLDVRTSRKRPHSRGQLRSGTMSSRARQQMTHR